MVHFLKPAFLCGLFFFVPIRLFAADIVVGMSALFSGPSASLGIEAYRGSMAYLKHINSRGGVHGRKVVLKAYDNGYDPTRAIQNTIDLVEKDQVLVLFAYQGTPTVTRVLPLLKSYRERSIFLLFPYTGAQPHRQAPYAEQVFNLRASYRQETKGLVDHFIALGRKRIAVFYQADAYGRSGWDGVRRALAQNGNLKIVAEATYRRDTGFNETLDAQVKLLKSADADAVVSIGTYAACAAFIRDARDMGWQIPIANVSFVGSDSLMALLASSSSAKDYTRDLVISEVVPSFEDTSLSAVREYRELMEKYRPTAPAAALGNYQPLRYSFASFEGFLDAKLLVEILKRMGDNPARSRLRQTVEGIKNFDLGIDVPISFAPDKHEALEKIYYTTLRAGKVVPLTSWQQWKK
jgi:ABC-type branched-subunit amino acid transport system substrate-binding protein